jgi:hypothetical protein
MTTLIAAGDSFTWGSDLKDSNGIKFSNNTWSALTAKYINADYRCVALPGGSNSSVARRCIHQIETNAKTIDDKIVMVMWTYPHRLEIKTKIKVDLNYQVDSFTTVSPWHAMTFEEKMSIFSEEKRNFFFEQHTKFEKAGVSSISQENNKFLNDDYYFYETFKSQVFLKNYLDLNNIPYYFLNATAILLETNDPYISTFKSLAEQAKWLKAPPFNAWAIVNKFEIGDGNHPLEPAHAAYFEEFIKPIMTCDV